MKPTPIIKSLVEPVLRTTSSAKNSAANDTNISTWFNNYVDRTKVWSWNSIIAELARSGDSLQALKAFAFMRRLSVAPNRSTFPCTVKSCSALHDLFAGRQAHQQALIFGYESDLFVSSSLIVMYSKCGELKDARLLFVEMSNKNAVSWTSMISGYIHNGSPLDALKLFKELLIEERESAGSDEEVLIDSKALSSAFSACSNAAERGITEGIHGIALKMGFVGDSGVGNSLMDAYAKCGYAETSRKVFDEMPERDFVSWNSMIAIYAQTGLAMEALAVFTWMVQQQHEIKYNAVTLSTLLFACAHMGALRAGKSIHEQVL